MWEAPGTPRMPVGGPVMEISTRDTDGIAIVDVTGNLIGGLENSERFHALFLC